MKVGFVGLGSMGEPMALNLVRAKVPVVAWDRSPDKCAQLWDAGARIAKEPAEVFALSEVVLLMLANGAEVDEALGRGTPQFSGNVAGRTVVCMGSASPGYAAALALEVAGAGGRFVEAPVHGSREPAQAERLVGLLAGRAGAVAEESGSRTHSGPSDGPHRV